MRGNGRVISGALVSAGVCSALAVAAASAGAVPAAAVTRAGGSGTQPVIIFLKNQWAETGSRIRSDKRTALIQAAQAP
jgi:Flp pilus assembly protein CpaB